MKYLIIGIIVGESWIFHSFIYERINVYFSSESCKYLNIGERGEKIYILDRTYKD